MVEGEMRFYPQGRTEIVARTGRQLAEAGITVLPETVAKSLGESHATEYEQALRELREQK